jgi:hypothetical protein
MGDAATSADTSVYAGIDVFAFCGKPQLALFHSRQKE